MPQPPKASYQETFANVIMKSQPLQSIRDDETAFILSNRSLSHLARHQNKEKKKYSVFSLQGSGCGLPHLHHVPVAGAFTVSLIIALSPLFGFFFIDAARSKRAITAIIIIKTFSHAIRAKNYRAIAVTFGGKEGASTGGR